MRRVLWTSALAVAVAILVAAAGGAVARSENGQSAVRFTKIDPALYASDGAAGKFTPASLSNKQVTAVVQLGGAPVAVRDANAKKQATRQARRDERAQRNRDREAGLIEKGVPIGPAEQAEFLPDAEELAQMDKEIAGTE